MLHNDVYAALNVFKDRRIDWVFPADAAKPKREIAFLQRAGVQHINPIAVPEDKPFILNNPDLLIFSHNRTPAVLKLLKQIQSAAVEDPVVALRART